MQASSEYGRPAGELERAAVFALMSAFPSGVAIASTLDGEAPRGLAANAFTSVSADPVAAPRLPDRRSRMPPTTLASGRVAVNFLAEGPDELKRVFESRPDDTFARVARRPGGDGPPVRHADTIGHVECAVERELELGDHVWVLGRALGGHAPDGRPALVDFRRTYGRFAPEGPAA